MSTKYVRKEVQPLVDWCLRPASTVEETPCLHFSWAPRPGEPWEGYTGLLFYRPAGSSSNSRPRFIGWGELSPDYWTNPTMKLPPIPYERWFVRLNIRLDTRYLIAGATYHKYDSGGPRASYTPIDASGSATVELDVKSREQHPGYPADRIRWTLGDRNLQLLTTTVGLVRPAL
jgi:hypothetical protein